MEFCRKKMIDRLNQFLSRLDFYNLIDSGFYITTSTDLNNQLINSFIEIKSDLFIDNRYLKILINYNYKSDDFKVLIYFELNSYTFSYTEFKVSEPLKLEYKDKLFYFNYIDSNRIEKNYKLDDLAKMNKFLFKRDKIKSIKIN